MGMKREAVQEERQRKDGDQSKVESTSNHSDMPVELILEAEKRVECKAELQSTYEVNPQIDYSYENCLFSNF